MLRIGLGIRNYRAAMSSGSATSGVIGFWNGLSSRNAWKSALAWMFMGLGILTKGPVGLIVPAGAYAAAQVEGMG